MNITRRVSSDQRCLPGTNIHISNMYVLPSNKRLNVLVRASLGDCIHDDCFIHPTSKLEFGMNLAHIETTHNVYYVFMQIFKQKLLSNRIDLDLFCARIMEVVPFTSEQVKQVLRLCINLRLHSVMYEPVHVLLIRHKHAWDVHFVKEHSDQVMCLSAALSKPRLQSFLITNIDVFRKTVTTFFKCMLHAKVGMVKETNMYPHVWLLGNPSLRVHLSLQSDARHYIALQEPFDSQAVLVWHMILFDDMLEMYKFPRLFSAPIKAFLTEYSGEYLKHVIQQVPDMWKRSVPNKYKSNKFEKAILKSM